MSKFETVILAIAGIAVVFILSTIVNGPNKEPSLLGERIEAMEKALLAGGQDLRAHKQEAQRVKELLVKQQLIFLELLKRQDKRIEALERGNRTGLFCGARRRVMNRKGD